MARVALIKVFAGMNLPVSQLGGELVRAGHEVLIVFLKRLELQDIDRLDDYERGDQDQRLFVVNRQGVRQMNWSVYHPFSEAEQGNLIKVLSDFKADAVGLSCLSAGMTLASQAARLIRETLGVPVIAGGTGPTMEPQRAIEWANVVCIGEGEETILEFAERLTRGGDLHDIAGTWGKAPAGEIVKNPSRPLCALDDIAEPLWDPKFLVLVHGDEILYNCPPWVDGVKNRYVIMSQRGCPFSCSFCIEATYQEMFGKKNSLRRRRPELVLAELRHAKEMFRLDAVSFFDDVFTVNPRWLDEFLPRYKEEIGLPFWCYTYPGVHTRELLEKLKDAGCRAITMGIQSGSERLLEVFNRKGKRDRVISAAHEIMDVGIRGSIDLIPMTVFDTEEDLRATFDLLLEIPYQLDTSFYNEMVYFPNYRITQRKDRELPAGSTGTVDLDTYFYYLKLYNLTRTDIPRDELLRLSADPAIRADHDRLNPLLNDDLPFKPIQAV